jgi:hypothetical protein
MDHQISDATSVVVVRVSAHRQRRIDHAAAAGEPLEEAGPFLSLETARDGGLARRG